MAEPDSAEQSGEGVATGARFCARCYYDLSAHGVAGACPECGAGFDPDDAGTWIASPSTARAHRWARIVLGALIVGAAVLGLLYATVIPRPVSFTHTSVWLWLGDEYGWQYVPTRFPTRRVWWWGGEVGEVQLLSGRGGDVLARVTRGDASSWDLRIEDGRADWRGLLDTVKMLAIEEDFLGIQVGSPAYATIDDAIAADPSGDLALPLLFSGRKSDLLGELLRVHGMGMVRSMRVPGREDMVWVWDEGSETLTLQRTAEVEAREGPLDRRGWPGVRGFSRPRRELASDVFGKWDPFGI